MSKIKRKQIEFAEALRFLTQVHRTGTQSIPSGAYTPLEFTEAIADDRVFWSGGAPSQLVVPANEGGDYIITAVCEVALDVAPPTGGFPGLVHAELGLNINGTRVIRDFEVWYDPSMSPSCLRLTKLMALSAGDVITLVAYQNSGASLDYSDGPGAQIEVRKLA